jgi:hypothetical protein
MVHFPELIPTAFSPTDWQTGLCCFVYKGQNGVWAFQSLFYSCKVSFQKKGQQQPQYKQLLATVSVLT